MMKNQKHPQNFLRKINILRHGIQLLVLGFIVLIPVLSLYQSNVEANAIKWMVGTERVYYDTLDHIVRWFTDHPAKDLDLIKGSVWSGQIGSFKFSDPLAFVGQTVAEKTVYWPFLLTVAVPVLLTLLLGRFFCGWICPAYLLYELGDVLRQLLNRAGMRPSNYKLPLSAKYLVLVIGLLVGGLLSVSVFPMLYPPAVISREWHSYIYTGTLGMGSFFLGATLLVELTVSRRAVCRYLCPGGALYSLLGKFRIVRIRRNESTCTRCVKCDDVCGLGLQPMTDKTGMECNTCTACIAVCPVNALTLKWGWKESAFSETPDTRMLDLRKKRSLRHLS